MQLSFSRSLPLALAFAIAIPAQFQAHPTATATADADSLKKLCDNCTPNLKKALPFLLCLAAYIRLQTKSTAKEKIERNWTEFFLKLASLLNVTQIGTKEYWELVDLIVIGYPLKLLDKNVETVNADDPNVTTIIEGDKIVKQYPSGIVGYFDAYVLLNLKKFFEGLDNLTKLKPFIFDSCA